MGTTLDLHARRLRRHRRVRARIHGTAARPRLAVFRSVQRISAQVIDDVAGRTLVAVYERELSKDAQGKSKTERASAVGALLGERVKANGITALVLDRGSAKYHGRLAALADAVRAHGISL